MPANRPGAAPAQQKDPSFERRTLLGLAFLLLFATTVIGVIWLAQVQFARDFTLYDVELPGQVQGLSKGGAVFLNGVRTGEVTGLKLDPNDPGKVVARIQLSADTPVRLDTVARLEWMGLSGTRIIQLSGGDLSRPLLKDASDLDVPLIHGAPGVFNRNSPDNKPAAAQALDALNLLNERLSDRNLEAIGGALEGARANAAAFRANVKTLGPMDDQLAAVAKSTDALSQTADKLNGTVNGDLRQKVRQLADSTEAAKGQVRNVRTQLVQAQGASEAQLQALPALSTQIGGVAGMVAAAGDVVEKLDGQQPMLGAPAAKELKVDGAEKGRELKVAP